MNSTTHLTEIKFSDTKLNTQITAELEKLGFIYCTPIQAATLPFAVIGKDIAGQAQTGTGKTIAFLAAAFHHLISNPLQTPKTFNQPRALIIAPTRELVVQIYHDAQQIASKLNFRVANAYGGDGYDKQLKELTNGVDILVATTGRLIDYVKQNYIDLSALEVLVLDEADRMFDLGFIKDLRWLFRRMPPYSQRLTMLFSATLSLQVKELAFEHMNEPQYVEIEPTQRTNKKIKEELFYTSNSDKMALLQTIIEEEWPEKGIIFANTKHTCELICAYLAADQHRVGLLTSDVPQKKRLRILDSFAKGDLDLLVATDVVSRGIHIPSVTHVFNYDLPDNCDDYVHRIGRTGRAGESGHSISFACEKYATNLPAIEASIEHPIPVSHYNPEALLTDLPKPHIPRSNYSRRPGSMKTQRNRTPKTKRA